MYRERRGRALAALADAAESAGDLAQAIRYGRERVALDPFDEPAHRDLIVRLATAATAPARSLCMSGSRSGCAASSGSRSRRRHARSPIGPLRPTRRRRRARRDTAVQLPAARDGCATAAGCARPAPLSHRVRRARRAHSRGYTRCGRRSSRASSGWRWWPASPGSARRGCSRSSLPPCAISARGVLYGRAEEDRCSPTSRSCTRYAPRSTGGSCRRTPTPSPGSSPTLHRAHPRRQKPHPKSRRGCVCSRRSVACSISLRPSARCCWRWTTCTGPTSRR